MLTWTTTIQAIQLWLSKKPTANPILRSTGPILSAWLRACQSVLA
jgi:hypothetical protein